MADRATLMDEAIREYERLNARMAHFSGPTFLGLDITMAQAKVLYLIRATGSLPMSELVARLGVTVPTVTGIVDRLVERDLVVRRGTPDDRRRVLIEITPAGVELIDAMRDMSAGQLLGLLAVMDDAELGTFLDFLRVLQRALGRLAATTAPIGVPVGAVCADVMAAAGDAR
jgi:DNA-binding MarR family transcriptional regulator